MKRLSVFDSDFRMPPLPDRQFIDLYTEKAMGLAGFAKLWRDATIGGYWYEAPIGGYDGTGPGY